MWRSLIKISYRGFILWSIMSEVTSSCSLSLPFCCPEYSPPFTHLGSSHLFCVVLSLLFSLWTHIFHLYSVSWPFEYELLLCVGLWWSLFLFLPFPWLLLQWLPSAACRPPADVSKTEWGEHEFLSSFLSPFDSSFVHMSPCAYAGLPFSFLFVNSSFLMLPMMILTFRGKKESAVLFNSSESMCRFLTWVTLLRLIRPNEKWTTNNHSDFLNDLS